MKVSVLLKLKHLEKIFGYQHIEASIDGGLERTAWIGTHHCKGLSRP